MKDYHKDFKNIVTAICKDSKKKIKNTISRYYRGISGWLDFNKPLLWTSIDALEQF